MSQPGITEGVKTEGSYEHDNLIAGTFHRITQVVTISGGAVLEAGTVLGRMSSTGQYVLSDASANNGSEEPDAILAHHVDASLMDAQAQVYLTGEFNQDALILGDGHTLDSISALCRVKSIFFRRAL